MFRIATALFLTATSLAAQGTNDISGRIAQTGLAATAESLKNGSSASDRFAMGGVLFLRAIEKTLQTRWQHGMARTGGFLPVLRLPVPPNPSPDPFRAELVEELFQDLLNDMTAARAPLQTIADTDDVAVTISMDDLWFDIDMDGVRSPQENLTRVAAMTLRMGMHSDGTAPTIRFDTADAAWLAAYTHLLSAVAEVVLSVHPAPQIRRVMDARSAMAGLGVGTDYSNALDMVLGSEADVAAMVYFSLKQQPDKTRTRAARSHLLAMIADNRTFWARVGAETDNVAEWIPNAAQVSGLGLTLPPDAGEVWQSVLQDGEDVLEGRKLIPFWRLRQGAGINLKKVLENPEPIDIVGWAHGDGLLPFMEDGERVSWRNWQMMQDLAQGDAALMAAWLN